MKFSDRNREEETIINLTPLIDVVFLLLIFFMVSTTFSRESQLRIKLPESSDQPAQEQEPRIVELEISSDGAYAVRGPEEDTARQLLNSSRATLRTAVMKVVGGDTDVLVMIRADRQTPHESVIRAMDVSRTLGLTNITFATQQIIEDSDSR